MLHFLPFGARVDGKVFGDAEWFTSWGDNCVASTVGFTLGWMVARGVATVLSAGSDPKNLRYLNW